MACESAWLIEKNMINQHFSLCDGNSSTQQYEESEMHHKEQYIMEKTYHLNKSKTKSVTICIELNTWEVKIKLFSKICSLVINTEDWYNLLNQKSQIMLFMFNNLDDVQLDIGCFKSSLTKYKNSKVLNLWNEKDQIMLGEITVFELFRISGLVNVLTKEYKNLNIKQLINNITFTASKITGGMLTFEVIEDTIQKVGSKYGAMRYLALNELLYYHYEIFDL